MAFKLSETALRAALQHLAKYGDTDIFPHLPEIAFFSEKEDAVVDALQKVDLDTYEPGGATECLAPKSRLGFRLAHQTGAVDAALLLASAIEIGVPIENYRTPPTGIEAFSYRFKLGKAGAIFAPDHTYREWLRRQKEYLENHPAVTHVLHTDISDFYLRINFHRLENYLDLCAPKNGAAKFILKTIRRIRVKQSFGIPVGGSASRLLAELALSDTDRALADQGLSTTRYVDDFRIFLGKGEEAYHALAFLAEQLGINEGLSLNVSKTELIDRAGAIARLDEQLHDVSDKAGDVAWEALTSELYFDEEPSEEDLDKLAAINLLEYLDGEIGQESWDIGKIRVIFRALKLTKPVASIEYVCKNFDRLVPFSKELTLLMQVLEEGEASCFDELQDAILDAILRPPASSVQLIRSWLIELFVRGIVAIPLSKVKRLEVLNSPSDKRQLLLLRGRLEDVNYFRKHKTAWDQFSATEAPCLVWGMACLPMDEFENWLKVIRPKFKGPVSDLFCDWVLENKAALKFKLAGKFDDHGD